MKTDELISTLVSDASPVGLTPQPSRMLALWLALAVCMASIGILMIGPRADWRTVLHNDNALAQVALMLILAGTSAVASFALSIPGSRKKLLMVISCLALAAWTVFIASATLTHHSDLHAGTGWRCLRNIVLLGTVPGFLIYRLLRLGFALRPEITTLFAVLAVSSVACAATKFICPHEDPLHFLTWHYLPTIAAALIGPLFAATVSALRQKLDGLHGF